MGTVHNVISNFTKKGFNLLGSGCYSAVFESNDDPNIAYKVGTRLSDPFLAYISNKDLTANAHFPKVHDIKIFDDWYFVKMEKLDPVPDHKYSAADAIELFARDKLESERTVQLTKQLKDLITRINELADQLEAKIDLHKGNIMMRGMCMVITDPLCDYDIDSSWELETWLGTKKKVKKLYSRYTNAMY